MLKLEFNNIDIFKDLTHEKGLLSRKKIYAQMDRSIKDKIEREKIYKKNKIVANKKNKILLAKNKKAIKKLDNIKNVLENKITKKNIKTKYFLKNCMYCIENINLVNLTYEEFVNFYEKVSILSRKIKNFKIDFIEAFLNDVDYFDIFSFNTKYSEFEVDENLKKINYIFKIMNEKESDNMYDFLYSVTKENFKKIEDSLFELLKNNEINYNIICNILSSWLHQLKIENLTILLNKGKLNKFTNYYPFYKNLNNYDEDIRKLIIKSFYESNISINELYYVCLLNNIENNIDLKKINISCILNRLISTQNKLTKIDINKLNNLLETYLIESPNNKSFVKRLDKISYLFENKKVLSEKIELEYALLNF